MDPRDADRFDPHPGPPLPPAPPTPPVRQPRQLPPPFCAALIVVCVAVFLGEAAQVAPLDVEGLALFGPYVARGDWWRVVTTVVVHGGFLHLLLNMMAVVNLGFPVERMLGTARMAAVSVVALLGAGAMVLAFSFGNPTVGASGMILGWAGVLFPVISRESRMQLASQLALVVVISLMPGVSWQGHVGGFAAGLSCGGLLRLGPRRFNALWPVLATALAVVIVVVTRLGATGLR
jgi:rhomboid protease GluP